MSADSPCAAVERQVLLEDGTLVTADATTGQVRSAPVGGVLLYVVSVFLSLSIICCQDQQREPALVLGDIGKNNIPLAARSF